MAISVAPWRRAHSRAGRSTPGEALDRAKAETQSIRDAVNLRELAEKLGIAVDRNGKALCLWHEERTPSMVVGKDRESVHCFGCGKSGDCFDLVMQARQTDFGGAKAFLREYLGPGLSLPAEPMPRRERKAPALPAVQAMETDMRTRWHKGAQGLRKDRDAQAILAAWRGLPLAAFTSHIERGVLALERERPRPEAEADPPTNKFDLPHWQWATLVECPLPDGTIVPVGRHRRVLDYKELKPLKAEDPPKHAWKVDWFYSKGAFALPFWAGERDLSAVTSISIIEGQWDAIALDFHLRDQGVEGALVLGLRGASSPARIEQFWLPLLRTGLPIVIWPDNDTAGHCLFVDSADEPSFFSRLRSSGWQATVALGEDKDFNALCVARKNRLPGLGAFYRELCAGHPAELPWFRVNPKKSTTPLSWPNQRGLMDSGRN